MSRTLLVCSVLILSGVNPLMAYAEGQPSNMNLTPPKLGKGIIPDDISSFLGKAAACNRAAEAKSKKDYLKLRCAELKTQEENLHKKYQSRD